MFPCLLYLNQDRLWPFIKWPLDTLCNKAVLIWLGFLAQKTPKSNEHLR